MSIPARPAPDAGADPADRAPCELLETGQEEVFSRTEVERGVTEHAVEAGRHPSPSPHPPKGRDAP